MNRHVISKKNWTGIAILLALIVAAVAPYTAVARQIGLYFDAEDNRIFPSTVGYVYHRDFGLKLRLNGPQDMFLDHEENLWIVDTGNNRILKTDKYGELLMTVPADPREITLRRPEGVFVNKAGEIFVADTQNNRVVQFNPDGTLNRVLPKPESVILGEDFNYQPTKLAQDYRGYLYVVNSNDYRGLMMIDTEGLFRGFFAPNRVPFSIRRIIIQLFATEAQKEKLSRDLPTPHSNLHLDESGFIYTSTIYERKNQIKKLNAVGKNIFPEQEYGLFRRQGYTITPPSIIDLTVDEKGIVSAVDTSGYVYQYDQDGNLLLMFGDKGEFRGAFGFPTAIEVDSEGYIYVLDKDRNNVQVFRPTQFAELVHTASQLYTDGRYDEAAGPWREILQYNTNYSLAHSGIAKAYMRLGMWDEALHHYRLAKNREGYSEAFIEKRYEFMRHNFGIVVAGIVAAFVLIYFAVKGAGWVLRQDFHKSHPIIQTLQMLLRVMLNPGDAFYDLRHGNYAHVSNALILVLVVFFVRLFNIQFMSFQIHRVDPERVSLLAEIARIIGLWLLFSVANYGVGAIFEGEGRFRDVLIATAYSTGPYLFFSWPLTLLTHVMSRNELALVDSINVVILYWVALLVFLGVRTIHNYSIPKAAGTSALTVFGMMVVIGVLALVYALTEQMFSFAREIMVEITIRT